jgi:hypothetical protein
MEKKLGDGGREIEKPSSAGAADHHGGVANAF